MTKLYCLPGTLCTSLLWHKVQPLLTPQYQIHPVSIPNHLNFEQIAQQLLIQGDAPKHWVGFSLGAYIAAFFASRFPQSVASLTLIANSPTALPQKEIEQRYAALSLVEKYGYKGTPKSRLASLLSPPTLAPPSQTNEHLATLIAMHNALGEETFLSQYRHTTEREDLADALLQLPCPVQFYYAIDDPLINTHWMQQLQQRGPHIRFVQAQGSGHMLPLEQAEGLAQVIRDFV